MRVEIDEVACIGCGLCPQIAPGVFQMEGEIAEVIVNAVPEDEEEEVQQAAESCPTEAILTD